MLTTNPRKVGGSVEGGRLVIESHKRPHYTLAELRAEAGGADAHSAAARAWLDAPAVGRELL